MKIDLKQKPMEPSESPMEKDGYYPSFSFETSEDHELPESGTMTIEYKKTSSTEEESDGKTRYRCTIQPRAILGAKAGKGDSTEENEDNEEGEETEETETETKPKKKREPGVEAVLGKAQEY